MSARTAPTVCLSATTATYAFILRRRASAISPREAGHGSRRRASVRRVTASGSWRRRRARWLRLRRCAWRQPGHAQAEPEAAEQTTPGRRHDEQFGDLQRRCRLGDHELQPKAAAECAAAGDRAEPPRTVEHAADPVVGGALGLRGEHARDRLLVGMAVRSDRRAADRGYAAERLSSRASISASYGPTCRRLPMKNVRVPRAPLASALATSRLAQRDLTVAPCVVGKPSPANARRSTSIFIGRS